MSQAVRRCLTMAGFVMACMCTASCGKKPAPPPAPVAVKSLPPKPAENLPARLPGLWQTSIAEAGGEDTPQTLQICIDATTDRHLGILGTDMSGDRCTRKTVSHLDDGSWGLLAECAMGNGVKTEYSGSVTGDYTQDYAMKLRSQTTGGSLPQMNRVTNYIVTSKRIGPCAADQRPGDVINDGVKVNLFDMSGLKGPVSASARDEAAPKDVVD